MGTLEEIIRNANAELLAKMVDAIIKRYEQLYPNWQISFLVLEKTKDYNDQISRTISLLEYLKVE